MDSRFKSVGIIGAGNWGTALAILAARAEAHVWLYDRSLERVKSIQETRENKQYLPGIPLSQNIQVTNSMAEVFSNCTLIMPVVPAVAMRHLAQEMSRYSKGSHILVHGTKGLEPQTHLRMSEILAEETGCLRVGTLSGPNLAGELAADLPGATVVASRFDEVISLTTNAFQSSKFKIQGSSDLAGVEWIGAFKNILALGAGFCSELKLGQNATAMILTQGLKEILQILSVLGAQTHTVFGLAGFGDIIATSTSPLSRNFRMGRQLALGKHHEVAQAEFAMTVEGINTLQALEEIRIQESLDLKVIPALWRLAYSREPSIQILNAMI